MSKTNQSSLKYPAINEDSIIYHNYTIHKHYNTIHSCNRNISDKNSFQNLDFVLHYPFRKSTAQSEKR